MVPSKGMTNTVVETFLERYDREVDFFSAACRICATMCEDALKSAQIRSIVTWRAKRPAGLREKLEKRARKREEQGQPYSSDAEIYADIVDLAGVRIALYFPGDRDRVRQLVEERLILAAPAREFPHESSSPSPTYTRTFPGYKATHLRVVLREESLSPGEKRYAKAHIEIQVASVLMHAWAEVEHDLVYKPENGTISNEEHLILDELNGLVLAGELALQRLQAAVEQRGAAARSEFKNHHELAAFILKRSGTDATSLPDLLVGRMDVLFRILVAARKCTPDGVLPYIDNLQLESHEVSLAQQVIGRVLTNHPELESMAQDLGAAAEEQRVAESSHATLGRFMLAWVEFEQAIGRLSRLRGLPSRPGPVWRVVEQLDLPSVWTLEIRRVNQLRNAVAHGEGTVSPPTLEAAIATLREINEKIGLVREL